MLEGIDLNLKLKQAICKNVSHDKLVLVMKNINKGFVTPNIA